MKSSITRFTAGVAAVALLSLPALVNAQPPAQPPAAQKPEPQPPAAQKGTIPAANDAAREHLAQAKTALDSVEVATLSARAKSQVAEIKRRINTLERSVSANDSASATGQANRSTTATAGMKGKVNWGTEVAAIDKTLTAMLGPDSPATPPATGTAGTAGAKSATSPLDEATRAKLMEVRKHLTAFSAAMVGGVPKDPAPSTEPTAEPPAATPPSSSPATPPSSAPATAPPPSAAPQPVGTTGTTPAASAPQQTPAPAAQPDAQTARRHLTEARNTLSALTQLPAASQLAGDARTQVSQLISNFNELITTQAAWRASYAKVNANLTALLGPDPAAGTADASSTTGGAVGTSGSAAVTVDPTIREKLVELRRQLNEFEKAAGGAAPSSTPSATPEPTAPATPPAAAPPASTPPAGTPPATTPPSSPAPSATPADPASGTDALRHLATIEALLKTEDDSGGLTLTKVQMEQLRAALTSLRQALDKK